MYFYWLHHRDFPSTAALDDNDRCCSSAILLLDVFFFLFSFPSNLRWCTRILILTYVSQSVVAAAVNGECFGRFAVPFNHVIYSFRFDKKTKFFSLLGFCCAVEYFAANDTQISTIFMRTLSANTRTHPVHPPTHAERIYCFCAAEDEFPVELYAFDRPIHT